MSTVMQKVVLKKKPESFREEFEDMRLKIDSITEMFDINKKR